MKKFNGTDYDGLLPLAYNSLNSQQLDGKTFSEIQDIFTSTDLYLYTSSYIGAGGYGENSPTVLTFPFEPSIIFMPRYMTDMLRGWDVIQTRMVMDRYSGFYNTFASQTNGVCYIKCSIDRKTFSLFSTSNSDCQYNTSSKKYYFTALVDIIGGKLLNIYLHRLELGLYLKREDIISSCMVEVDMAQFKTSLQNIWGAHLVNSMKP